MSGDKLITADSLHAGPQPIVDGNAVVIAKPFCVIAYQAVPRIVEQVGVAGVSLPFYSYTDFKGTQSGACRKQ